MDAIERIEIPAEAPGGTTNAYLVGRENALLVDPADRTDELDKVVERRNVSHVAVTHAHPDHVGGVEAYATEHELTVWARYGRADRFERATGVRADRTFSPGTTIPADDGVGVIDATGHTPDHIAFAADGALLVGDCAVRDGSVAVAAPDGDLRAYLTTLRRLRTRKAEQLLPGHGSPVDEPTATIDRLIEHRRSRERRVLAAVHDGARTTDDVLDAAYDKDISGVRELARRTVEAHLHKLAVEGSIVRDGDDVRPS